ncbi:MAG: MBL fold metallo-hydrolase [Myxococcales bacterium]|nr:MBL fold metallo-hydrolase [Myxococcales bacterium]
MCSSPRQAVLEVLQVEVGLLDNFSTLLAVPSGAAAIVDPGFEADRLLRIAAERGWRIEAILVTHSHDDHVAAIDEVAAATGAVIRCHPLEVARVRARVGVGVSEVRAVADGEAVTIGDARVEAIYTPGHAPGCVCWFAPTVPAVITGDVLYVGSCGSVSDPAAFVDTLQRRLATLPEMTRVFPGHNYGKTPTSTLAWELVANPAFAAATVAEFCAYKGLRPPGA